MFKILSIACLCILLVSCHSGQEKQESADCEYRGDTLLIAGNSAINQKIKLETVRSQVYSTDFNTTGTVKAIPAQIAEIAPPFSGRVVRSFVQLGQRVKAGTPIFELSSGEFYEAAKSYFDAFQTKKMTEVNFRRQQDLVQHGVGIQKELESAETDYELAQKAYENAAATLRVFNVDPSTLVMGQNLKVVSPIDGEVVQSNMVTGQYVKSDAAPLAIVAELSKVWVVAQVKEKYINVLQPQDKVEIHIESAPDKVIEGRVYHIGELLDEETRSVQVLVECDNSQRLLKPGMFAAIHFVNVPKESIIVPSTALMQTEAGSYIFVQLEKGKYLKRMVKATTAKTGESLITEGINVGDMVISEGGIYLLNN